MALFKCKKINLYFLFHFNLDLRGDSQQPLLNSYFNNHRMGMDRNEIFFVLDLMTKD